MNNALRVKKAKSLGNLSNDTTRILLCEGPLCGEVMWRFALADLLDDAVKQLTTSRVRKEEA